MDGQTLAIGIVIIIVILLLISVGFISYIAGFILVEIANSFRYKRNTKKLFPLLDTLLKQNPSTRDVIDLYKSIFDVDDKNTPDFVQKMMTCLEDFKTWKLENENSGQLVSSSSGSRSWRDTINGITDEIKDSYPFSDLKPEHQIFFEDFKKFLENRELEASKLKLSELARLFSAQDHKIEKLEKEARYALYVSIIGIAVGICGIIFTVLH